MGSRPVALYTDHFGLARNPFTPDRTVPPPFPSVDLQEAFAHYQYARKNRESFFLLVGEVGTGKSTAIQVILDSVDAETPAAVLRHTSFDAAELLEEVVRRFGLDPLPASSKPELLARLEAFLNRSSEASPAVLIIDEAHVLSDAALQEVRLLSNLKHGERPLIQILLVGQPELLDRLRQFQLRPLRQRITVRYVFGRLSSEETREYIRHRLKAAGAGAPQRIFSLGAADAVHELTQGLPREINVVADQAMLNAYLESTPTVERRHVCSTKDDYGFEGAEGDHRAPETLLPAPTPKASLPAPAEPQVDEKSSQTETQPVAKGRRRDLPLQPEPRFALASPTPNSRNWTGAFAITGIATGTIGAIALGYVLYSQAVSDEFGLPEPPPARSIASQAVDVPGIPEPASTEPWVAGSSAEPETEEPADLDAFPVQSKEPAPNRVEAVEVGSAPAGSMPFITGPPPSPAAVAADRLELGTYLARNGLLDEAIAAFREAIELEPNYSAALSNLGVALLEKGRAGEAVDVLRLAMSISPDGPTHLALGIALRETDRLAEAVVALKRAVELLPSDELALRNLAWVLRESGDVEEAVEATRRTIALKPGDASLHQELGFEMRAAGRLPEAATAFRRAIELDGKLAIAHYSLGVTLLELGDRDGGEREVAEARRLGYDPR